MTPVWRARPLTGPGALSIWGLSTWACVLGVSAPDCAIRQHLQTSRWVVVVASLPAIGSSCPCGTIRAAVHLVLYLVHLGFELRDGPVLPINHGLETGYPRAKQPLALVQFAPDPLFLNSRLQVADLPLQGGESASKPLAPWAFLPPEDRDDDLPHALHFIRIKVEQHLCRGAGSRRRRWWRHRRREPRCGRDECEEAAQHPFAPRGHCRLRRHLRDTAAQRPDTGDDMGSETIGPRIDQGKDRQDVRGEPR